MITMAGKEESMITITLPMRIRNFCPSLLCASITNPLVFCLCACTLAASLILAPCSLAAQQPPNPAAANTPQFTTTSGDAMISAGDLLSVSVFDTPEFSGTMRVSNEGSLSLPLIGSLHIAGLTASSAAELIRNKLIEGNFLKDPQVAVSFVDFINQSALVLGEVMRPGPVPVLGSRTLWEIIGAAGGASATAANRVLIIHRNDPTHPLEVPIDWSRDLSNQPNPRVSLGDTVQVPRAGLVYVIGEVGRQGAFPIQHERMTMLQIVSLAEGVKFTSKSSEARLMRMTPNGRQISIVNIPALLKGKIADFPLQNDDILYVPISASKVVISRGLEAAVGITTSLAIIGLEN
jgi:polysaccharide export outer membrane protein